MKILLIIILALLALWDSSGSFQTFGITGLPLLSVSALLAMYLTSDLTSIFVPLLVTGFLLDLYGGMREGTITLSLIASFGSGELLRSRWLSGAAPLMRFFLSFLIYLIFNLTLLLLQLVELHKISVAHNPISLVLGMTLGSVVAVLFASVFSPYRERLSVKGLE